MNANKETEKNKTNNKIIITKPSTFNPNSKTKNIKRKKT